MITWPKLRRELPGAFVLAVLLACIAYTLLRKEPEGIPKQAATRFTETCTLKPDAAWSLAQQESTRLRRNGKDDVPGPERQFLVTPDGFYFFPAGEIHTSSRKSHYGAQYTEGYYVNPSDGTAAYCSILRCSTYQEGWLSLPKP